MMNVRYFCMECKESFKQSFINTEDMDENAYCPVCNSSELEVEKR